jgi:hypothetical protein
MRNQAFIVTYFSKTREKFCDHLLGEGEKKRVDRKELLIKVLQYFSIHFRISRGNLRDGKSLCMCYPSSKVSNNT